jgi:1-acyl-sn-glycerol-3-phosphate acyltransferase
MSAPLPPLDLDHWYLRPALAASWGLWHYHRTRLEGRLHEGPCIYVARHGAGYLSMDLVLAIYALGWQEAYERGGPHRPLRIAAARSQIERAIPGAQRIKEICGLIDPSEDACVAALEAGQQLLLTPGGHRECQPSRDFYRLRWTDRLGFVRLAVRAGVPIVPLAIAGGAEAFPGFRLGKLSFWSPLPLPVRVLVAIGEPIPVERAPERARDLAHLRPLQARAWSESQALLDRTVERRRALP